MGDYVTFNNLSEIERYMSTGGIVDVFYADTISGRLIGNVCGLDWELNCVLVKVSDGNKPVGRESYILSIPVTSIDYRICTHLKTRNSMKNKTTKPKKSTTRKRVSPKKAIMKQGSDSFTVLEHALLTTKYTTILQEDNFKYNAPHTFKVTCTDSGNGTGKDSIVGYVHFQEGPVKEVGVNGIANEDALVMVLRRLECFQESAYACRENAIALTRIEEALMWLRKRTNGRVKRDVEGTSKI